MHYHFCEINPLHISARAIGRDDRLSNRSRGTPVRKRISFPVSMKRPVTVSPKITLRSRWTTAYPVEISFQSDRLRHREMTPLYPSRFGYILCLSPRCRRSCVLIPKSKERRSACHHCIACIEIEYRQQCENYPHDHRREIPAPPPPANLRPTL